MDILPAIFSASKSYCIFPKTCYIALKKCLQVSELGDTHILCSCKTNINKNLQENFFSPIT